MGTDIPVSAKQHSPTTCTQSSEEHGGGLVGGVATNENPALDKLLCVKTKTGFARNMICRPWQSEGHRGRCIFREMYENPPPPPNDK